MHIFQILHFNGRLRWQDPTNQGHTLPKQSSIIDEFVGWKQALDLCFAAAAGALFRWMDLPLGLPEKSASHQTALAQSGVSLPNTTPIQLIFKHNKDTHYSSNLARGNEILYSGGRERSI